LNPSGAMNETKILHPYARTQRKVMHLDKEETERADHARKFARTDQERLRIDITETVRKAEDTQAQMSRGIETKDGSHG